MISVQRCDLLNIEVLPRRVVTLASVSGFPLAKVGLQDYVIRPTSATVCGFLRLFWPSV